MPNPRVPNDDDAKLVTRLIIEVRHVKPVAPNDLVWSISAALDDLFKDWEIFYKDGADTLLDAGVVEITANVLEANNLQEELARWRKKVNRGNAPKKA